MSASEIILERMKTHPEEFVALDGEITHGTWSILINNVKSWATPEEIKAIADGMAQARRLLADEVALKILSGEYYESAPFEQPNLFYRHPYNQHKTTEELNQELMIAEMKKQMREVIAKKKAQLSK